VGEAVTTTGDGAILYDTSVVSQIDPEQFTPEGWLHSEPVSGRLRSAGRGNTQFVGNVPRQFVLRHYVRGGLPGRLIDDRYVFTGAERTRSFSEWRLLAKLSSRGLRVPRPAAARFVRHGLWYTADLITVRIPDVRSLSVYISGSERPETFWARVGREIARFHEHGVFHADMNAYNLQIDADGDLWMLDFDRGRLAPPGAWRQKTLARLHRSLDKVASLDDSVSFGKHHWEALLGGYFDAARST